jgi:mannose/fructose-specific phosphotransferase system component IIA
LLALDAARAALAAADAVDFGTVCTTPCVLVMGDVAAGTVGNTAAALIASDASAAAAAGLVVCAVDPCKSGL